MRNVGKKVAEAEKSKWNSQIKHKSYAYFKSKNEARYW
jgi:hypothetical protein